VSSRITIRSNLASLNGPRRLSENSKALEQSYTRLSSGMRINRTGDDAAEFSISESPNVNVRIFAQGIRILNDGISLTNVAEGSLHELWAITIQQSELATQAVNGTLSNTHRQGLDQANQAPALALVLLRGT
jgi:flagellin